MEYVAEKNTGNANSNYVETSMMGGAWTLDGQYHSDPGGTANDPYVSAQQSDSFGAVSVAFMANGLPSPPADPMYFLYLAP
jgi:hypothetical protein